MKFNPKSEKEIQEMNLIDPGIYAFEVLEAEDALSKKGKEMIKLKLKVWDVNGHERIVYDYLLEAMSHKLKHFADSTNLADKYQFGELNATDCLSRRGRLELVIQPGDAKPEGGFYASKNSVKDYLKVEDFLAAPVVKDKDFQDNDLPF